MKKFIKTIKDYSSFVAWAGCIIIIISCFLPFAIDTVMNISVSYTLMEELGLFVIISSLISAILIFFGKSKLVFLSGILPIIFITISVLGNFTMPHIGVFTMAIGLIALYQYPFLYYKKEGKGMYDTVKLVEVKNENSLHNEFTQNAPTAIKEEKNEVKNVFCRNCGNKIIKSMRFCNKCGARLQL